MGSQYLSASIWAIVTATSLLLVLLALGIYLWYQNRLKAVIVTASSAADLAARKDQLEAEIEQSLRWLENNKEELLKLDAERTQQEKDRQEIANLQTELAQKEQNVNELRREASDLQNVVSSLSKDRDRLESEKVDFEKKRDEANIQANAAEEIKVQALIKAKDAQKELDEKYSEIRNLNEKTTDLSLKKDSLAKKISDKETKLNNVQVTLNQAEDEAQQVLKTIDEGKKLAKSFKNEKEKLKHEIEQKQRQFNDLIEKVTEKSIQNESFSKEISIKQTKLEELAEKVDISSKRLNKLGEAIEAVEKNLNIKKEELPKLEQKHYSLTEKNIEREQKAAKLEARLANLENEIERHKGTSTKDEDVYGHLYELPDIFTKAELNSPHGEEYTEEEALRGLKSYLDKCKLLFPTRALNAFHTSLKIADISTLAVMAGISGTGKSELPRRYAEALGMHFLLMAVQPRWDSPQDMFGFYNYIEQRYKATELAQSLVRMDKWNHPDKAEYADRMLLVLLDEMNLARVEYYFSEFLSKLEIRKSINPNNLGDRRKAEISLDVGSRIKGQDVPRLYVHENVLFVGTMNEDESTQTLSDKVIDRANVLRFGRPEKMISDLPVAMQRSEEFLPLSVWKSWKKNHDFLEPRARGEIEGWIEELNNGLDDIGRPFGYRINQAIFSYVANYPAVNAQNNHRLAFADQMEQRILPKMRGLDIEQNRSCFETIRAVMEKLDDKELDDAFDKAMRKDDILFSWYGVTRKQDQ
jgi:hypothetical protein